MNQALLSLDDLQVLLERHSRIFKQLAQGLMAENKIHNLTRITDPESIRVRHFLDSLAALKVLEPFSEGRALTCLDVGSGAGFPVFPLAIARPSWRFVSVESTGKKAAFQRKMCGQLGLDNVEVVSERAEELAHQKRFRERFDAVLVRAVADLAVAAELSVGLVRPGGQMMVWKGPNIEEELQRARQALEQMGAGEIKTLAYLLPTSPQPAQMTLVVAEKIRPTPANLPRSFAQIKQKPLGRE